VDPFARFRGAPSGGSPRVLAARPIEATPPPGRRPAAPAGNLSEEFAGARQLVQGRDRADATRLLTEAGFSGAEIAQILGGNE
jgi:hypothetical protein